MRTLDWTEILDEYIIQNRYRKYKYGSFDCVLFSTELVKKIIGINLLEGIDYNDMKTGLDLLKKSGGLFKLTDLQMNKVGLKTIPLAFAQRGDVVGCMTEEHGETLGICIGSKFVSTGEDELVFLPMKEVIKAWRIK